MRHIRQYRWKTTKRPTRNLSADPRRRTVTTKEEVEARPRQYRTGELAAAVGVATRTVAGWILSGKVKATRTLGGHARIDEAEFQRVVAEAQVAT
jgi:excisionase family DNA binding protein